MIVSYDIIKIMKPPYNITPKMVSLISDISLILGRCDGLVSPVPTPQLRKQNRVKTIQGTLSIEGNTLSIEQVTAIIDNKRVIGPPRDILEVTNAIKAYDQLDKFKVNSIQSLCSAHKIFMNGLTKNAGKFRTESVGILKGGNVVHIAPKSQMVPELMNDLFEYLKNNKKDNVLILSSIFHYELEFIHPFGDGNGRTGRFWQSLMFYNYHPVFKFIPIESVIKENQNLYYQVLEKCDKLGDSTSFVEFMLEITYKALSKFLDVLKPEPITFKTRIDKAEDFFTDREFSRKDYINFFKNISPATASRDLKNATELKILKKEGDKRLTTYKFMS